MRYLSHLARESTAKMMPSRGPSWLPRVGLPVIEETMLPENAVGLRGTTTLPNPASHAPAMISHRINDFEPVRAVQAPDVPTHSGLPLEPDTRAGNSNRSARPSAERDFASSESSPVGRPAPATDLIPLRLENAVIHPRRIARAEEDQQVARTIQSVLAEVARRQEELELRYRSQQTATRVGQAVIEAKAGVRPQEPMGESDVRLNIGSIVVQVDPPPAAAPLPPPRPAPPARDTRDRWARSFLDR